MKIDFRIANLIARRSRLPSSRCTRTPWMTLRQPAPRQHWTIKGDFDFRGSKSGWGIVRCAAVAFSHCHCLFVQDPGEQGAKAPCSPLSFSLSHCPLSIVDFPFSCLPAEGVGGGGGGGDFGDGGGAVGLVGAGDGGDGGGAVRSQSSTDDRARGSTR